MEVLATRCLTRLYGRRTGIDAIDLSICQGEIFGFLGPNGAGKTTTIRVLLGLLRPDAGGATIFGRDCWRESPEIKQSIGYLPGDVRLYPWFTCRKALRIAGAVRGMDLLGRGSELASRFELDVDLPVRRMSRGTRQKIGLVLALAHSPRLLILDEPTSGLDPLMQDELAAMLREHAAEGCTVFFSSHTLSEVESLCSRVAIVKQGRIVADETLEALRRQARRTVQLEFPDEPSAASASPPDFLTNYRRDGRRVVCELEGLAGSLVSWAAAQGVSDLSVSPPDLESLFRKYYESSEESLRCAG